MSELNKKMMQTPDLNEERLETLKKLFPDLFTIEGKLNPDELKKIIDPDLVKETERFEFKWFGKSEAKRVAFTPAKATLVYDEERTVNPENATGNMIIEGENLETLKCLLSAYREKIKCIYIDPPYNTGKDFVYSDKWDESKEDYWEHIGVLDNGIKSDSNLNTNGRYHSDWLSFIYSRIVLARQFLKEDGLIFISIDDNEFHHLKKICDEIFNENNHINTIVWKKRYNAAKENQFAVIHEYLLVYAKDKSMISDFTVPGEHEYYENHFNEEDEYISERGKFMTQPLEAGNSMDDRPNLRFPIIAPDNTEIWPRRQWVWGKERVELAKKNGYLKFYKNKDDEWKVRHKYYMKDENGNLRRVKPFSIYDKTYTQDATKEFENIFEKSSIFPFPKPSAYIRYFLSIIEETDFYCFDFFSGSGTTAQAVIDLNKIDGGYRKFILVQIPELTDEKSEAHKAGYKKISDITIERNKRVIERIEKEEAEKDPSLFGSDHKPFKTGFKVYKLAKSNFPRVDFSLDPTKSDEENLQLLENYIEEKEAMFLAMIDEKNIFDEVLLKNGFMLNYSKEKVDSFKKNKVYHIKDDYKECLICMEMSIDKETLKEMENHKDKLFICLERSLDTTMKWNLKHLLGDKLIAF